jgi:RND superfamily putative drug exporter
VRRRARPVWLGGTAVLVGLALGLTQLDLGLAEGEQFTGEVDAAEGAGIETTLPLIAFVFLVALGVDYNIFLVARAREEADQHGTSDGMHRAPASTGSVITSAGVVLAGTFSILALIPFVALVQLGLIIAFGVLLDTLLVRSVIVPALVWDVGPKVW